MVIRSAVDDLEQKHLNANQLLATFEAHDRQILVMAREVAQSLDDGAAEVRQRLGAISQLQRSIVNLQQHIKLRADALKQQPFECRSRMAHRTVWAARAG